MVAGQGDRFVPERAYVGEPDPHLTLLEGTFALLRRDRARVFDNRTVDLLFQPVAGHGGHQTIGVVLSGSLDDGSRGLAATHHAGGNTMVLRPSPPSSHGMPENAIAFDGPVTVIGIVLLLASSLEAAATCD